MTEKKQSELMKDTIGKIDEEELKDIAGAGNDVEAETTVVLTSSAPCIGAATAVGSFATNFFGCFKK